MKTNQYSYIIVCAGSVTLHPYLFHINRKNEYPDKESRQRGGNDIFNSILINKRL